ncbi:uncharacterized protein LOC143342788 [Colletes latitarsis]|uniref:uncharacterized protein LOC143342788 n=1 Tax=Colletes latitarsis TaxID=2605962 RepID=UPI0040357711
MEIQKSGLAAIPPRKFKRARAKARKILKQAKKNSWINYIASLTKTTPCEQLWNKLKKINGQKVSSQITAIKSSENSTTTDATEIANLLATTFANNSSNENFDPNFLKIKASVEENSRHEHIVSQTNNHPRNMKILPTELQSALKSVKNSSPGPDSIPNIFIQQLPKAGISYLLDIYNCIWLNGVFPTKWQEAIVVPILKPGKNKLQVDSYRPIALTCCLCKLLEKIICKRLRWYLEINNLLEKNQNGFRQYRSTIDNLAMLDINICEAFRKKQHLIAICLDIEKAYDMLWRHRIIQQLIKWNVSAGLTPLETRRKQLSLSYAATRLATPSNPIYEQLTNTAHFNEFKEKPKLPKPLNNRVKTYWQELNIDTPRIMSRRQYQIPPWTIDPPCILDKILEAGKNTNLNVLKSLYTELSNEYPHHTQIFTDASKSGEGTGCAVCTPEHELLFRLPETSTVFTSEASAVLQALKYIEETTHSKSIILTDSKSTLLALQNLETNNTVIQNIIETLKRDKREVLYSWIPAHISIEGNEKADKAAKLASSSTTIMKYEQATHQDIQKHYTKALTEVWNEEWRNSRPTKLHKVRNNIYDFNPALLLNRKDQVKTTRLRIGHSSWTHSYLITKTEPNSCNTCNVQNTIEHILTICPKYNMKRIQHKLQNSLTNLREIDSCKQVLNFLKDIKVYQLL